MRNKVRHDGVGQRFALMSVSHCHTLDDVALQTAASHDVPHFVYHGSVVVYVVEPKSYSCQKLLDALALARQMGV